ncbi:MAG: hypothetical protein JW809_16450 [Pirellulales bacterium]|nr:hypothetical protein [Pirellulales bacterium]
MIQPVGEESGGAFVEREDNRAYGKGRRVKKRVYNLEFRSGCREMDIGGYHFERVPEYPERLQQLQHLVNCHSEVPVSIGTGGHAHTADVVFDRQQPAVLGWGSDSFSALDDILLLLSLFTTRHVFAVDVDEDLSSKAIVAESRVFPWGGLLATSIPYEEVPPQIDSYWPVDVSLGKGLDAIYQRIGSDEWLSRFDKGHFLFLAFNAFQQRLPQDTFIHCWTIWEHLFSVLTRSWLTAESIKALNASEKIAFLLVNFAVRESLQETEKKRLQGLAAIRNRIIHFGRLPKSDSATRDAAMFVRMTEFIIASILGLQPSNIFNTIEKFEDFLTQQKSGRKSS